MRATDALTESLFTVKKLDVFVPVDQPLRPVRVMVNQALRNIEALRTNMYAVDFKGGRPGIAPEMLLRAVLLQIFYRIRSERILMEESRCNLLFRWFIGPSMDDSVWVPAVFSKNRERLIKQGSVVGLFNEALAISGNNGWLSNERFSFDGILIRAWVGYKSFVHKDDNRNDGDGGNFKGRSRGNDTHASSAGADARLCRKGNTANE